MNGKWKYAVTGLLLLGFALTRWPGLGFPVNFSAAYALAFCAGAFPRRLPWWMPLSVMVAMDVILNVYYYDVASFPDYLAINYIAYVAIYLLGRLFSNRASILKLVCGGLLGAIVFYLITNTSSWLQNPEYAKTLAGWIRALTTGVSGLPPTWTFFRNTLLSGGLFTGIFAAILKSSEESPEPEPEEAEESAEKPESDEAGESPKPAA